MKPVTTDERVGGIVGGNESLPVGRSPRLRKSTTPAEMVPLLACTWNATCGASGVKSETRRVYVECGATMMPPVLGGLIGPRADQKLRATLAGASAGLARISRSSIR